MGHSAKAECADFIPARSKLRTEPARSRTWNLLLRRQTRYPLRHWPCSTVAQAVIQVVCRHKATAAGLEELRSFIYRELYSFIYTELHSFIYTKPQEDRQDNMARSIVAQLCFPTLPPTIQRCAKPAVTRIRTGVAAATTQSTNHYTITANHGKGAPQPPAEILSHCVCSVTGN